MIPRYLPNDIQSSTRTPMLTVARSQLIRSRQAIRSRGFQFSAPTRSGHGDYHVCCSALNPFCAHFCASICLLNGPNPGLPSQPSLLSISDLASLSHSWHPRGRCAYLGPFIGLPLLTFLQKQIIGQGRVNLTFPQKTSIRPTNTLALRGYHPLAIGASCNHNSIT